MFINRGRFQYLFNLPCSLELVWLQAELETERLISKRILKINLSRAGRKY